LLLLTLSAVPDAVTNVAAAVLRVSGRMGLALLLNGGMLVLCIVATWFVLPFTGIMGAGACWLASQTIGAIGVVAFWGRLIDRGCTEPASEAIVEGVLPAAIPSAAR
jgi:O-antigen/teichoic acid export membrane protein